MKTTTSTATTTTSRGTIIGITATATRGYEVKDEVSYCDGDNVTVSVGKKASSDSITLDINGNKSTGYITTRRPSPSTPLFYGYFVTGKSVYPFEKDVYTAIENCQNEAIIDAETDESWINFIAAENKRIEEEKAYDAHVANMKKAMSY